MKITLIYADWCQVCQATKKLWKGLKAEHSFDYEEVSLTSPLGMEYVKKYNIHSVPATLIGDRVAFFGLPERDEAIKAVSS
ncbi:MAG TPA: thioredoxin family protein [Candidatus Methanoperedens sp.]